MLIHQKAVSLNTYRGFFYHLVFVLKACNAVCLGIVTAGCGTRSLRLRPAAILEKCHVDIFLDALEQVLRET